jgi:class 3 adenylate cyclase
VGSSPEWSPDGKWIAFTDGENEADLWIVRRDGTDRIASVPRLQAMQLGRAELAAAVHTGRVTPSSGANSGQVLVSHSTHALLEGELLGELGLRDLGQRELPGITPIHVYELVGPPVSGR